MEDRKKQHIELAFKSQTTQGQKDNRFVYEPMLRPHPVGELKPFDFVGKQLSTPIWASSMTGGTELARQINENIARVCRDFGMGMGLGSCRALLDNDEHLKDFDVRPFIGTDLPLYANLGVAQVQLLIESNSVDKIKQLVDKLNADGLIVHVNPFQEWFQPEGNAVTKAPIDTVEKLMAKIDVPIIVKEVGQGMGFESLKQLLQLPLQAIEFGAYGGTNFSMLEMLRSSEIKRDVYEPFAFIGQSAEQMVDDVNKILETTDVACEEIIIAGGVKHFLDGFYLMKKLSMPSVFGMASEILKHAVKGYDELYNFIEMQVKGLQLAENYLRLNPDNL